VGKQDAFAQQVESGSAEHLPFDRLETVDVAFDRAGAVFEGAAVADGVQVTAQMGLTRRLKSRSLRTVRSLTASRGSRWSG
jgi:hypothetical protein